MSQANLLTRLLAERGRLLFDSAMGTALIAAGMKAGQRSEEMNLSAPETVTAVHRANIVAGCDVVTTNTFGAHPGWADRDRTRIGGAGGARESGHAGAHTAEAALRAGIRCARRAASEGGPGGKEVFVALDIGPLGEIIGFGDLSHDDARRIFADMVRVGVEEGADMVLVETMSDLEELRDAVWAAKTHSDLPVLCSMTFDAGGHTFMGVTPEDFAREAEGMGVDAVGANCSLGPKETAGIAYRIAAGTRLPTLAQPNAGQPAMRDGEAVYETTPEAFAEGFAELLEKGVSIAGGCCGTTPEMIAKLRESL
jgi:5-methyltetrahydrofolate--homocysteine methyltransferase